MWNEISQDLLFSKGDAADPRVGESVKILTGSQVPPENSMALLGYPDDEGIQLNGGRPGAAQAPDKIRKFLYRMTPSLRGKEILKPLYDLGNLKKENSLLERHEEARRQLTQCLKKNIRAVTLGGGHDYGFPDAAAFCETTLSQGQRPAVINFDAHLDVRPDSKGLSSGTPFYRLLKEFFGKIDFFEVGIQDWCNARDHWRWAIEHGAQILSLDEILTSGKSFSEIFSTRILGRLTKDHRLGLSVDIDGFSSSFAPGASQVFPVGLDATSFMEVWRILLNQNPAPNWLGIYEVSPPLDLDDRTSRLASILTHQFLYS